MASKHQVEFIARLHRQCTGLPATKHQKDTWHDLGDRDADAVIEGYSEAIRTGSKE